ncbi:MAG: pseudouridine synthase [Neisseria sp.]|nr:pseudouridine synthase [Neisseria sp.]
MQLFKYLQAQGLASRKQCLALIAGGNVEINGRIQTGQKAEINPAEVRSMRICGEEKTVVPLPYFYIILNKPAGYETSHRPRDYPSIFSLFPDHMRNIGMQAVGRLDADTTGVILITNDGGFNHRATSPKHKIGKLYRATLKHPAGHELCQSLKNGVLLHDEDETVCADHAVLSDPHTLLLTLTEGKYHQVKRMVAAAGNRVERLHRLQFGDWQAEDLPVGGWRFIVPEVQK